MNAAHDERRAGTEGGLPRITGGALSAGRIVGGFVVALVAGPLLTWLLVSLRSPESITVEVLAFQLLAVVVALIGGLYPAVFTAVLSGVTLDLLFVAPSSASPWRTPCTSSRSSSTSSRRCW